MWQVRSCNRTINGGDSYNQLLYYLPPPPGVVAKPYEGSAAQNPASVNIDADSGILEVTQ